MLNYNISFISEKNYYL